MFPLILADLTRGRQDAELVNMQARQLYLLQQLRRADSIRYAALWIGYTRKSHQIARAKALATEYADKGSFLGIGRRMQLRRIQKECE